MMGAEAVQSDERAARVRHIATGMFAHLNCAVDVTRKGPEVELRVASNAFEYYGVAIFRDGDHAGNLEPSIEGLRDQMVESIFLNGARVKAGYPRGHLYK